MIFILYRKNGPSVVLLSAPAKGDLVYGMYKVAGTLILIQRKNMK